VGGVRASLEGRSSWLGRGCCERVGKWDWIGVREGGFELRSERGMGVWTSGIGVMEHRFTFDSDGKRSH
jgi:hypothetical protein